MLTVTSCWALFSSVTGMTIFCDQKKKNDYSFACSSVYTLHLSYNNFSFIFPFRTIFHSISGFVVLAKQIISAELWQDNELPNFFSSAKTALLIADENEQIEFRNTRSLSFAIYNKKEKRFRMKRQMIDKFIRPFQDKPIYYQQSFSWNFLNVLRSLLSCKNWPDGQRLNSVKPYFAYKIQTWFIFWNMNVYFDHFEWRIILYQTQFSITISFGWGSFDFTRTIRVSRSN